MDSSSFSSSRREFLGTCGALGAAATMPISTVGQAASEELDSLAGLEPDLGRISPEGRASIRSFERRFQKARPKFETIHAVENLGLDPTGKTSISDEFSSKIGSLSNKSVVFPSDGTFKITHQATVAPPGPIEIIGNGCTFFLPPHHDMRSFVFVLPSGSLVRDFTIDQTAKMSLQEISLQSRGVVRGDNVTIKGYAPARRDKYKTDSTATMMFAPIARTEDAIVRATNFKAVGGTAAGTHDENDLPPDALENVLDGLIGIFIGASNLGTIQLVNLGLSGWSNGIYGGRTTGTVEVLGGKFVNNFNAQTRIGGGSVVDGAEMLLDDRLWHDKGPFKIGHQGVYAARIDAKHGNLTDPAKFKNLKVIGESMREGASLFDWESKAGQGIIKNCEIVNHLDRPAILGEPPNVPGAANVLVAWCLIRGDSPGPVMVMNGRQQSRIRNTCIKVPDAGPEDIVGADIGKDVSFGKCKPNSGLKNPKKVGNPGDISELPTPDPGSNPASETGPYYDIFSEIKGKDVSDGGGTGLLDFFLHGFQAAIATIITVLVGAIVLIFFGIPLMLALFAVIGYLGYKMLSKI
jgi:hypothetical protein